MNRWNNEGSPLYIIVNPHTHTHTRKHVHARAHTHIGTPHYNSFHWEYDFNIWFHCVTFNIKETKCVLIRPLLCALRLQDSASQWNGCFVFINSCYCAACVRMLDVLPCALFFLNQTWNIKCIPLHHTHTHTQPKHITPLPMHADCHVKQGR